jgi:hypothetical protein
VILDYNQAMSPAFGDQLARAIRRFQRAQERRGTAREEAAR